MGPYVGVMETIANFTAKVIEEYDDTPSLWRRINAYIPWTKAWRRRKILNVLQPWIDEVWTYQPWPWDEKGNLKKEFDETTD